MANYLTTDTDLTTVANAIRTKGGTSAPLSYPSGFAQAIADLPIGGDWEEIDYGGEGTVYDVFIVIDQLSSMMASTCSVTVGTKPPFSQTCQGRKKVLMKNVPKGTAISFTGNGDTVLYSYGYINMVYGQGGNHGTGANTVYIPNTSVGGTMFLLVGSPEG